MLCCVIKYEIMQLRKLCDYMISCNYETNILFEKQNMKLRIFKSMF